MRRKLWAASAELLLVFVSLVFVWVYVVMLPFLVFPTPIWRCNDHNRTPSTNFSFFFSFSFVPPIVAKYHPRTGDQSTPKHHHQDWKPPPNRTEDIPTHLQTLNTSKGPIRNGCRSFICTLYLHSFHVDVCGYKETCLWEDILLVPLGS